MDMWDPYVLAQKSMGTWSDIRITPKKMEWHGGAPTYSPMRQRITVAANTLESF